jgi:predicted ester cyclase
MGAAGELMEGNVAAWNAHDEAAWSGNFAQEATLSGPGGVRGTGGEMVSTFYHLWQDAFPDNRVRTVRIVDGGDSVVLEAVFEGTHTETLNAPGGSIPATGKQAAIPFALVTEVDEGRFTSFSLYFDQMELLTQLGLVEAPGAGGKT